MPLIFFDFVFCILLLSFIVRTFRNIFYQAFLWQIKEYRVDRMLAHLKTNQGKKLIFHPISLFKWFLLFFIIMGLLSEYNFIVSYQNIIDFGFYGLIAYLIFGFTWVLEAVLSFKDLIFRSWKIPQFTIKIIIILIVVSFFQFIPLVINRNVIEQIILGPFLDRLLAPLIFITVIFLQIPTLIFKKIITGLAIRKILKMKNLKIVGITGSYGKTSTKEFLYQILSYKFRVLKTEGSINTEIGISKTILKKLNQKTEIFIVEMGAYKKGEIKSICKVAKPKIGIITGINEQHLELFGSLSNTMKAKFELIESLPCDGIAIFNGNNKYCLEMASWSKKIGLKPLIYSLKRDVRNIKISSDHLNFTFISGNKEYSFSANLLGKQTIENLLAAIYAARSLGLTFEEIKKALPKVVPPPKTMRLVGRLGGMLLVDDTFNVNSCGVEAAIDYMKLFAGKKILILNPLIELGKEAEKIHEYLGEKAARFLDFIFLTNINYYQSFIRGAKKVKGVHKVQVINSYNGVNLIKQNIDKKGVVVFEGKEAGKILEKLLKTGGDDV